MLAIDTNLIVRYLTSDYPKQSPRARKLIDGQPVFAAITVILEARYLRIPAGRRRAGTQGLRGPPYSTVEDGSVVATALDLAEKRDGFADALHLGKSAHCDGLATFDRRWSRPRRR